MNTLIFKGIRRIGNSHNVADFDECGFEFCLNEASLCLRIMNLQRKRDTSTEQYALSVLRQRNFTDKLSTTFSSPAQ